MSRKKINQAQGSLLVTLLDPTARISEQFRTIRTNIQFSTFHKQRLKSMVVTSPGSGEGKSTVAANLAVVFAKSGHQVLLVDANLRESMVYQTFYLDNHFGLSTILMTNQNVMEAIQATKISNLSVLASGPKPANPSELLGSLRMNQIIHDVKARFDLVIFDAPAMVDATDAQILAAQVEGTLLVIRENRTNKEELIQTMELLKLVDANLLGIVYNDADKPKKRRYRSIVKEMKQRK